MVGTVSSVDGTWFLTERGDPERRWEIDFDNGEKAAGGNYDGEGDVPQTLAEEFQGASDNGEELTLVGELSDDGSTVTVNTINGAEVAQLITAMLQATDKHPGASPTGSTTTRPPRPDESP